MDTGLLILLIVGVVLLGLAVGGAIAQRRRLTATEDQWHVRVQQADHDLAAALAADRGWERSRLEAAARAAFAQAHPGTPAEEVTLMEVVDRPGTDEDRAVFRVTAAGGEHRIELARRGDEWNAA